MNKKVEYELEPKDIDKLSMFISFIDDRQERPTYIKKRVIREDYYKGRYNRRYDMYWIHIELGSKDLGYIYVDPEPGVLLGPATKYWLDYTGSKITYTSWLMIIKKVRAFFEKSLEYQRQIKWVKRLRILIEWDKRELEEY